MIRTLQVEGMSCGHCVKHVKDALVEIGGTNVEVSLEGKSATGEFDESIATDAIKAAVEDAGYDVTSIN